MATSRKDIRPDTYVSCPTCGCEIAMLNSMSLPREFSVQCPNCEGRKFYQADQVHDRRNDTKANQNPGKMQFGVRRASGRNPTPGEPMQPKSQLGAMTTWLLQ